ncbi:hypothetical protein PHLCEN_2v7709 [Hermanssonia centrifuga]|uniref:Uncharacterized protein n=1 Tax=Hermanssonia centrifuga TaxID=98765 RepID=A0A2R6NVR4_9APHY|nr:hypothetical protein PHLCEN_2v7709 [Hermanssonia centrifuga]
MSFKLQIYPPAVSLYVSQFNSRHYTILIAVAQELEALLEFVEEHMLSRDLDLWLEFLNPSGSKEPPSRYLLPAELDHPVREDLNFRVEEANLNTYCSLFQ